MNIQICDYCSERWPKHKIKMTRRLNDKDLFAEICDKCMNDFVKYVIEAKVPAEYNDGPEMIQNFYDDTDRLKPIKDWKLDAKLNGETRGAMYKDLGMPKQSYRYNPNPGKTYLE